MSDTVERRLRRFERIAETQSLLVEPEFDLTSFMQLVVDRVLDVSPADGAAVELVDGSEMVCRATSVNLQRHQGFRWPRQGSLSGLSVDTAQVLNCNDTEADPRVNLQLCRRIGIRSIACAPVMANGMALGVLKALAPEPDRFCDESLQLLRLLARTLGTALARQIAFDAALAKATKTVEAAAAAQADFLANMSHEIRTLLRAVIGFTSLLSAQPELAALSRQYVDRVNSAGRALLSIADNVLDLSKLEAGQLECRPSAVDARETANEALMLFKPQADEKGLTLAFEMQAHHSGFVMLDPDRFRQVLLNLIGNAVKFTEQGGVVLRLWQLGGRLEVEVEDTGPGLSQAQQSRLFQRFSQVDDSATRCHGGTGLGLAICKCLVGAMRGSIHVRSEVGRGSCFSFDVAAPAAITDQEAACT